MSRTGRRIYPVLVKLYPASFRREYGNSLVGMVGWLFAALLTPREPQTD